MKKGGRPAKFTDAQVFAIRNSTKTLKELSTIFQATVTTIWKVKTRKKPYDFEVGIEPDTSTTNDEPTNESELV